MQERPQVTITNPADPVRPADVLGSDDPPPGSPKPRGVAVGVVLALLAGVFGVGELRERRAADAEERRLQAVVAVELANTDEAYQATDFDGVAQEAVLRRTLRLRNTGPRPVVVESAEVDGLRLVGGEVEVAPGAEQPLLLEQRVPCAPDLGSTATGLAVRLAVRTGSGLQERELRLREDESAYGEDARWTCGNLTAVESVQLFPETGGNVVDGGLDLPVRLANYGVREARLLDVQGGSGLTAELLDDRRRPLALPLVLNARGADGSVRERPLLLRLRVEDCRLVDASDSQSFEAGSAFSISYLAGDEREPAGDGSVTTTLFDPNPVYDLLAEVCP